MHTLFEVPLRDIAPSAIHDWQMRFPNATVRLENRETAKSEQKDEALFWSIMDELDWAKSNRGEVLKPAIDALSKQSKPAIEKFHDVLNEKLFALDGLKFAVELGTNRFLESGDSHFSVDDFLYSRCGVVANGRDFFETVLANPKRIPKEFTFEQLLYLPERAWKLKTGKDDYAHFPEIWAETFSNPAGWPGILPPKERLLQR